MAGAGQAETAPAGTAPAIELRGISKAFGPVQANRDISLKVMPGTIHGIVGTTRYPTKTSAQATKPAVSNGRRPNRSDNQPATIINGNSDKLASDHNRVICDAVYPTSSTI